MQKNRKIKPLRVHDATEVERLTAPTSLAVWTADKVTDSLLHGATGYGVWENNLLIGFILVQAVQDELEIFCLAVDESYRQTGVATLLLDHVIASYPGHLFLEVRRSNEAALSLYQKHGFQQINVRPRYYQNPCEDAIVLKK